MITSTRFGYRASAVLVPACLLACSAAIGQDPATADEVVAETVAEVEATGDAVQEAAADVAEAVEEVVEAASDVLVTVNGVTFTRGDSDSEIGKRMGAFAGQVPADQLESLKGRMQEQVLDDFVNRTLLEGEVTKKDIAVEDTEVDEFIQTAKEGLPEGFTLEQFLEQRGLSLEDMRRDIGFQLAAKKLIDDQLGDQLTVTDEEVQEFFDREKTRFGAPEQVRARHILVKVEPEASDEDKAEKKEQIEALREKLVGGEDFAAVAASDSDCPSGQQGGDLGTFDRTRMVPPFAEAAFSQTIDEIGEVIETQFGYHVIQVLEKTDAVEPSLDESREQIVNVLQNQRRGEAFQTYMQELRDGSEIVYPGQ